MIYNGKSISPIDFSMCGYGIPEMDLGDIIFNIGKSELIPNLFMGYESIHTYKINHEYLNLCEAFGLIQYIVIHHKKLYNDEKFQKRINRWCTTIFDPFISQFVKYFIIPPKSIFYGVFIRKASIYKTHLNAHLNGFYTLYNTMDGGVRSLDTWSYLWT